MANSVEIGYESSSGGPIQALYEAIKANGTYQDFSNYNLLSYREGIKNPAIAFGVKLANEYYVATGSQNHPAPANNGSTIYVQSKSRTYLVDGYNQWTYVLCWFKYSSGVRTINLSVQTQNQSQMSLSEYASKVGDFGLCYFSAPTYDQLMSQLGGGIALSYVKSFASTQRRRKKWQIA